MSLLQRFTHTVIVVCILLSHFSPTQGVTAFSEWMDTSLSTDSSMNKGQKIEHEIDSPTNESRSQVPAFNQIHSVSEGWQDNTSLSTLVDNVDTDALNLPVLDSAFLFAENVGQFDDSVHFQADGGGLTVKIVDDGLIFIIKKYPESEPQAETDHLVDENLFQETMIHLSYSGASSSVQFEPFNRLNTRVLAYINTGSERQLTNVPIWGGVRIIDLYPGTNLEISCVNGKLMQKLKLASSSANSPIHLQVQGARSATLVEGFLRLDTDLGEFLLPLPETSHPVVMDVSVMASAEAQSIVPLAEALSVEAGLPVQTVQAVSTNQVMTGMSSSSPVPLAFSTYISGESEDVGVDADGFIYVTSENHTVMKFSQDGASLVYLENYLQTSHFFDSRYTPKMFVADDGSVYIAGRTYSSAFLTTANAYDTSFNGVSDAYVAKINPDGSLAYSTFIGGQNAEEIGGITVDQNGMIYVTGYTDSPNFPKTLAAYDDDCGTDGNCNSYIEDVFLVKLNPQGNGNADLVYATFLGGSDIEHGNAIAVNASGSVFVTGKTYSSDFPTTSGAYDQTCDGNCAGTGDVYVTRLDPAGPDSYSLVYSTFIGGTEYEGGFAITVGQDGSAYIAGTTDSNDFPYTAAAFDKEFEGGRYEAFIAVLNAAGSALVYASLIGGSYNEWGMDIALDEDGLVYVVGETVSTDFSTTENAFSTTLSDQDCGYCGDGFLIRVDVSNSQLDYATYFGGSGLDSIDAISLGANGAIFLSGVARSDDIPSPYSYLDNGNGFLFKMKIGLRVSDLATQTACSADACKSNETQSQRFLAEPINTRTGGYDYFVNDLSIQTAAGTLDFIRTYSTIATGLYTTTLGYGWTHSLESRLILSGTLGAQPGLALFKAHTVNQYQFQVNTDGTFTPYPGLKATLQRQDNHYLLQDSDQRSFIFDLDGKLTEYRDSQNHALYYMYNADSLKVMDEAEYQLPGTGRYLLVSYDPGGRIEQVQDHTNRSISFGYNSTGDLTSMQDVLGRTWLYYYEDPLHPHFLTRIVNPRGYVVEATVFDVEGRAIRQYDGAGYPNTPTLEIDYTNAPTTTITTIVDGQVIVSKDRYDGRGTLVQSDDPEIKAVRKKYDLNYRPMAITDALNNTTSMRWSLNGSNLEQVTDALGRTQSFTYDAWNNLTMLKDARGITSTYTYSGSLLMSSTDAQGHTTVYTYTTGLDAPQPAGLLKEIEDQAGKRTLYTYDRFGQKTALTVTGQGQSFTTEYGYDGLGRQIFTKQPNGRRDWTCYNPAGQVVRSVANSSFSGEPPQNTPCDSQNYQPSSNPLFDRITTYKYDLAGNLIATIDPNGVIQRTYYDAANRPIATVQNWHWDANADGLVNDQDLESETLPPMSVRTTINNITSETQYDPTSGRVIATIDWIIDGSQAFSRITRTFYDSKGRPYLVFNNWDGQATQPAGCNRSPNATTNLCSQIIYDDNGNVVQSIDAVGRITYTVYDALNRPVKVLQNWNGTDEVCNRTESAVSNVCTETRYDANGNITATTDALGRITRTYYDTLNRTEYVVENLNGWSIGQTTPPTSNLRTPDKNVTTQTIYDPESGYAIATIDPLGRITRTYYDDLGRPELVVRNLDPDHGVLNKTPPACNRDTTGAAGPAYNVCSATAYDPQSGQTIATIDPLNRITRTYFDELQRPIWVVNNLTAQGYDVETVPAIATLGNDQNVASQTMYDQNGRVKASISWRVENGQPVSLTTRTYYDSLGRAVSMVHNFVGDLDSDAIPAYDANYPERNLRVDTVYASDGRTLATIEWMADAAGQVYSRTQRLYYDALGRATLTVQNLDPVWGYANPTPPACNRDTTGMAGLYNVCQETSYNVDGNVTAATDALGNVTTYQYDQLGRQIGVTDALTGTTQSRYDVLSNRISVIDANGVQTYFQYDGLNRLRGVIENYQPPYTPGGEINVTTVYTYNPVGERLAIMDALGHVTSFNYDGLGRLVEERDAMNHTWQSGYDVAGRRVWSLDANGTQTNFSYDGLDRLNHIDYPGAGLDVSFGYNAPGWRTVMTDSFGLTTWQFDPLGRPLTITHPISGTVGYGYDTQGNRTRLIYPDQKTVQYRYDLLGRISQVSDWQGKVITYTYQINGQLKKSFLPNGVTTTYDYDPLGQLLTLAHTLGETELSSFAYTYDLAGNRIRAVENILQPGSAPSLNAPLTPTSLSAEQRSYQAIALTWNDQANNETGFHLERSSDGQNWQLVAEPAGDTSRYVDEGLARHTEYWYRLAAWNSQGVSAAVVLTPTLTGFDAVTYGTGGGSVTPNVTGGWVSTTISYTYDALNRLLGADYSDGKYFHYTYDAVGNRLTQAIANAPVINYTYDEANRLASVDGLAYAWDNNGNLLSDGMTSYTYDSANRLIGVTRGQTSASYGYNGLGDRISQTENGVTTGYALDLASGLTQVLAGGGQTYLYGNGRIAQSGPAGDEYFLGDALGSVRQMVDGVGSVTLAKDYQPYGEVLNSQGSGTSSYGYTNEYTSQGLIYLRARWYAPGQGRFVSRDTWQGNYIRPASLNKWVYGYANPTHFMDPSGLDPLNGEWAAEFQQRYHRQPEYDDIVIRLFKMTYPDEWKYDAFYNDDGRVNPEYLKVFQTPPFARSWESFPSALTRLASKYSINEQNIFVRDVGTLFGGLPSRYGTSNTVLPFNTMWSLASSWSGGSKKYVWVQSFGLPSEWLGKDYDANVHHWAASFVYGYSYGSQAGIEENVARECITLPKDMGKDKGKAIDNFQADIPMGNHASAMGAALARYEFSRPLIQLNSMVLMGQWQNTFHDLWDKYMLAPK